jgi:hypothetical protein
LLTIFWCSFNRLNVRAYDCAGNMSRATMHIEIANSGTGSGIRSENDHSRIRDDLFLRCYPNPFNPETLVYFNLPIKDLITLTIFDILGREKIILLNGVQAAGVHSIRFRPEGLASGLYFCQLKTSHNYTVQKMILAR